MPFEVLKKDGVKNHNVITDAAKKFFWEDIKYKVDADNGKVEVLKGN